MAVTQERDRSPGEAQVAVALVQEPLPLHPAARLRPRLRGVSHQLAAFAAR